MMRLNTSIPTSIRSTFARAILLVSISCFAQSASADQLPPVTGATFDGNVITWQPLDAAIGYNIYFDFRYVDTVISATQYTPDRVGEYRIAAYDGDGNFSPLQVIDSDVVATSNIAIVDTVNSSAMESPQNVTGTVYSNSAGELYWDQGSSSRQEYIVTINGVALPSTNGSSYWINSLLPNSQNMVTVASRNRGGTLSDPVTLLFDTRAGTFPIAAISADEDILEGAVASPQNARLEIYSATTAELFWDRATAAEAIASTEVYRDNVLIGTSPGNSFYDDTRSPNTLYAYELVAINTSGVRSAPTFIDPSPFDGTDESIVLSLLSGISNIANNNPHVVWYPFFQSIGFENLPDGIVEVSAENTFNDGILSTTKTYDCRDGSLIAERVAGSTSTTKLTFNTCSTDTSMFTGTVDLFSEGGLFDVASYDDLTIYSDTIVTINGTVNSSRARAIDTRTITYDTFSIDQIGSGTDLSGPDTIAVLNQTIAYDATSASATNTYTISMAVSAPWTQGRVVTVKTDETFSAYEPADGNYLVGSLTAESEDGESLKLIADTGDSATWYAELTTATGTSGVLGNWNDLVTLPCIQLNDACR